MSEELTSTSGEMPKVENEKFDMLGILSTMTGTKVEAKTIISDWLLITYDIPHTPDGDKLRREFLEQARLIGATKHTESVYLMPFSSRAELLALKLAKRADAIVWTSQTTDDGVARQLTKKYDRYLTNMLDEISERIDRQADHIRNRAFKRANRLIEKTQRLIDAAEDSLIRRGNVTKLTYLTLLRQRFALL